MKTIFVLFSCLFTFNTFAAVNNFSWTCTGHQLVPGGIAKPAPVTINATQNVIATYNNPWTFDFSFDGAKEPLFGQGKMCGMQLDADIECTESSPSEDLDKRTGGKGPFRLVSHCTDKKAHDVPPYRWTGSSIVMTADKTHGRFHCSLGRTRESITVELSDCKAK